VASPRPARPEDTVTSIAKLLGVSRNTIYNYVPELKGGRLALTEVTNTPELPRPARSERFTAGRDIPQGTGEESTIQQSASQKSLDFASIRTTRLTRPSADRSRLL
jgi:transposase-like protein